MNLDYYQIFILRILKKSYFCLISKQFDPRPLKGPQKKIKSSAKNNQVLKYDKYDEVNPV